jgi:hypothetical protein
MDDPKDLPYVDLEKMVGAIGVLSNDRDIERMGANRLTLDFVLSTRRYARTAVVSVGIRVSGMFIGTLAVESLLRIASTVKSTMEQLSPKLKLILLGAAVLAFLHPSSRAWFTQRLRKLGPTARMILETVGDIASLEAQNRKDAKAHLASALNCFVSKICGRVLAQEACQARDTERAQ